MKTWFKTLHLVARMMWIFLRDILSMWRDIPNAKGVDYSTWWGPEDELEETDGGPDPEEDVEEYGKNAAEAYAFAMANEPDFDTQRFMDNWLSSGQSSYELLELVRVGLVSKQEYTEAFKKYLDITYFSHMPKAVNNSADVVLEIPTGDQHMLVKHFFEPKEIVNPNIPAFKTATQDYNEKRDAIIKAFGMGPKHFAWNYQPILETRLRIMGDKVFMDEKEIGEITRVSNTGDDLIFYGKLKTGAAYEL